MRIEIAKAKERVEYGDIIEFGGEKCMIIQDSIIAYLTNVNGCHLAGDNYYPVRVFNFETSEAVDSFPSLEPLQNYTVIMKKKNIVIQEEVEEEEE